MNTIKVKGYASKTFVADKVKYEITFYTVDVNTARASSIVKKQCEQFLKCFREKGFDIAKFHLSSDNISIRSYDKETKKAARTVTFESQFDPKISNLILETIKNENLTVDIETTFSLSNRKQIHRELLKEALLDSKEKAEKLAEANNQHVKYIDTVSDYKDDIYKDEESAPLLMGDVLGILLEDDSLSAQLAAKKIEEHEVIYVSWVIE